MGRTKGITVSIPIVVKGGVGTVFTEKEAERCLITKCNKLTKDSTYTGYEFEVEDENGNVYEWIDRSLVEGVAASVLRTAIKNHLTTYVEKDTDIEYGALTTTSDPESIVGLNVAGVTQSA